MTLLSNLAILAVWLTRFTCNGDVIHEQIPLTNPLNIIETFSNHQVDIPYQISLAETPPFTLEVYLDSKSTGLYLHPDGTASTGLENAGVFKLKKNELILGDYSGSELVANLPEYSPYTLLEQRERSESAVSKFFFTRRGDTFSSLRWFSRKLGQTFGGAGEFRFCFCVEGICTGASDPEHGVFALIAPNFALPNCVPCDLRIDYQVNVEVAGLAKGLEKHPDLGVSDELPFKKSETISVHNQYRTSLDETNPFILELWENSEAAGVYLRTDGTATLDLEDAGVFKIKKNELVSGNPSSEKVANIQAYHDYTLLEQREPSDDAISTAFSFEWTEEPFPFLKWTNHQLNFRTDGTFKFCVCGRSHCPGTSTSDPDFGVYALVEYNLPGCTPVFLHVDLPPVTEMAGLEKVGENSNVKVQDDEEPFGLEIIPIRGAGRYWLSKTGVASKNVMDAATYQLQNKQLVNFEDTKEAVSIPQDFPYTLMALQPISPDNDEYEIPIEVTTTFEIRDYTDEDRLFPKDRQYLEWKNEELRKKFGANRVLNFCWCRVGRCFGFSEPPENVYAFLNVGTPHNCELVKLALDRDYQGTALAKQREKSSSIKEQIHRQSTITKSKLEPEPPVFKIYVISGQNQDIMGYLREDGTIIEDQIDAALYQQTNGELSMAYFPDILISLPVDQNYTIMDVNPRKPPNPYLLADTTYFSIQDSGEVSWIAPIHHGGGRYEKMRFCHCEGCIYPSKKSMVLAVRWSQEFLGCETVFLVITDVEEGKFEGGLERLRGGEIDVVMEIEL